MNDEEKSIDIGTLKWDMQDGTLLLHTHLKFLKPVTEKDPIDGSFAAASYYLPSIASADEIETSTKHAILYTGTHVLRILKESNIDKPVLLRFVQRQLRWDVKIECYAYIKKRRKLN